MLKTDLEESVQRRLLSTESLLQNQNMQETEGLLKR